MQLKFSRGWNLGLSRGSIFQFTKFAYVIKKIHSKQMIKTFSDYKMHVYRGPFKFQVEPYTDYYNQFSSQERNIGEDIHSKGPSLESNEDEEFWWMFAALFVVICFLICLFGLSLQLLARAILRHNQVQPTAYIKHESWKYMGFLCSTHWLIVFY